jgi:transposase
MIAITPQMRVLVALEPADFRRGIDGMARLCREALGEEPVSGTVYVFRNRRATAIKLLIYDGQGFWLCHKRLSQGRFPRWPTHGSHGGARLEAHELQVLVFGGDPAAALGAPFWRRVGPRAA